MSEKDLFVKLLEAEFPVTIKVLKAIPSEQSDFKPHDRSSSMKQIVVTLVVEMNGLVRAAKGEEKMYVPVEIDNVADAVALYENSYATAIQEMKNIPEEELEKPTPGMFAALYPKRKNVMWMFLLDSIHHRGQLSVYIRLAGGRVPSIYGPSADDNPFSTPRPA
jgi:uncharacterized damage-inducible protein DinB